MIDNNKQAKPSKTLKNKRPAIDEIAISIPANTFGLNPYINDTNIQRLLGRYYADMLDTEQITLESLGDFAATRLEDQANYSDRTAPPVLKAELDSPSAPKVRRNKVILNPRYEDSQQELYRHGILKKCLTPKIKHPDGTTAQTEAPHMLAFMTQYLASYADISTGCPLAMTHPNALALASRAPTEMRDTYLPQFLRTDGKTMIGGTWATEWAGGSDIRGNTETTIEILDETTGKCRLQGRQYFASAMGFSSWGIIKTVKRLNEKTGKDGIALVFAPSHLDDEWDMPHAANRIENPVAIEHLKEKSGTKGLPTAEISMDGTTGFIIADETQGLRAMMEALGCSRVHNAMAAAGVMQRAYNEALSWAAHRETFGKALLTRADIQADLINLKLNWMAGTSLAFEAARAFDDAFINPQEKYKTTWLRLVTALAKFKTAEQATECTTRATEMIGGTGYTQDHPIERVHRDAMVLRVWEGPKNIQAREVLGMLANGGAEIFLQQLEGIRVKLPAEMAAYAEKLETLNQRIANTFAAMPSYPALTEARGPALMDGLSKILSYALLCNEGAYEATTHNDMTKMLAALDYYEAEDLEHLKLLPHTSRLQEDFGKLITGTPLNDNEAGKQSSAQNISLKNGKPTPEPK